MKHREDRTSAVVEVAERWRAARGEEEAALRGIEGQDDYEGQQAFFEVCARLAREGRLSRMAYCAIRP